MTTASQVRTAAQLERLRLATEVARARAAAESQARQAESQTAAQAREAISETEQQAQVARSEVGQEAESRQAEIRKQRGQAEREAEAAKAQARQTQRVEQRKAVLPVSKPRDLGLASYVTNVETARKQAHQVGGSAKTAVTKVRDDYFQQVDKARDDAIADINKQKAGIVKDIQKQLVDINADLTKQLANANSGVAEWEKDSQSKIAKAQADYEAAIKATLNRSGTEVFADMKGKGLVPASAVYESYDKATGQLNYTTPDTRSGQEGIRAWQKDVSAFSIALTKIRDSYESTGFLDLARKYKAVEDLPDRFVFSVDRLRKALVNVRGQTRKDAERSYDELMALAQQGQLARYGAGNKSIEFAKPVIVEGHSEN